MTQPEPQYATREQLKQDRIKAIGHDYELPGVGLIRIRGLSRGEFLIAQRNYPDNQVQQERFILSRAVLIPEITEDDAAGWQDASGIAEINNLANKINALSGIGKDAAKS